MKTILPLLLALSSVAAQGDVNQTANCETQLEAINDESAVADAWTAVSDLMFTLCDDDEGCEKDKTGSEIILTYDFAVALGSNETEAYDAACAGVTGEITRVKTLSDSPVIMSCKAETADHIPYEVHLKDYFQCTGLACDEEDEQIYENALAFAVKVVDQDQNGVTCVLGVDGSGAGALATSAAFIFAAAGTLFALF